MYLRFTVLLKLCALQMESCPWITQGGRNMKGLLFSIKQKITELHVPICEITMLKSTMALPEFPKA